MKQQLKLRIGSIAQVAYGFQQMLISGGACFCLFLGTAMNAQVDCSMPEASPTIDDRAAGCGSNNPTLNTGGIYDTKYSRQAQWIPNTNTPEIIIPVAIHIFQDANGAGTFTDVPSSHSTLAQVIGWANQMFQDGAASSDPQPWQTHTVDCKINFVLDDRIYFYANTGYQNSCDLDTKISGVRGNSGRLAKHLWKA